MSVNYSEFILAYVQAYPDKVKKKCYEDGQTRWNLIKNDSNKLQTEMLNLRCRAAAPAQTILSAFAFQKNTDRNKTITNLKLPEQETLMKEARPNKNRKQTETDGTVSLDLTYMSTPVQDKIKKELSDCNTKLAGLLQLQAIDKLSAENLQSLKKLKTQKDDLTIKLKKLEQTYVAQKKFRENKKRIVADVCSENPEVAEKLRKVTRIHCGRPRIDEDQTALLAAIKNIAMSLNPSADIRRRNDIINSCTTLDDLVVKLKELGFNLSRSATYLRLLPHRAASIEGKRHVSTVPVRIVRAQNDARKRHPDQYFARAALNYLKDLAIVMGDRAVFFLSQDDKARVPLGLPAATKQAPILMHMEYQIKLPDHDWVVAQRHKLIPSVYAACHINDDKGLLTYSGPTYVAIRSGKHDHSTANSHVADFITLADLPHFSASIRNEFGDVKPVVIIGVDGGPDENPRFPKPLSAAVLLFKKYDLDGIFVATNAPGHSAYNQVERRMAPLSHDLAGLILPHDTFGTHLDDNNKTVDVDLEKQNFQKAGETLATIWSQTVIDNFEVLSNYLPPDRIVPELNPNDISEQWKCIHVQQSQYLIQVVKCNDENCCKSYRSNFNLVFPDRFLPSPVPFINTRFGPTAGHVGSGEGKFGNVFQRLQYKNLVPSDKQFDNLPFDYYCDSVRGKLLKRICTICGQYFPSQTAIKKHQIVHKFANLQQHETFDEQADEIEIKNLYNQSISNDDLPVFENIFNLMKGPFTTADDDLDDEEEF